MHRHSLLIALSLAEGLADDGQDFAQVRELRIQLRALVKDAEMGDVTK